MRDRWEHKSPATRIEMEDRRMSNGRVSAYIHMGAIAENFRRMKDNLREGVQMIAVIKTDGYGHGAVPIARMTEQYDYIWGYAVAAASEAFVLREAGITKPILILGYTFAEDYPAMAARGIRPTIFTVDMAREFSEAAAAVGVHAPVHLAVDTGMSRIGVADNDDGAEIVRQIRACSQIQIEGVFTHFARADETDKSFARRQLERFSAFCDRLEKDGLSGFLRHCSNSAGIMELPEANMDLVRAGISIYGIYPSGEMDRSFALSPAMELKSHVVYIKTLEAGTPISYGGTFVTPRAMRVATVPVGYGDGYPRSLSSKGHVLIRGKKAPILGRVCMDQFMVDVSDIEDAQLLDEVTLLGRDGDAQITIEELDALSGRFPYEFVCDIGKRVPRVYID